MPLPLVILVNAAGFAIRSAALRASNWALVNAPPLAVAGYNFLAEVPMRPSGGSINAAMRGLGAIEQRSGELSTTLAAQGRSCRFVAADGEIALQVFGPRGATVPAGGQAAGNGTRSAVGALEHLVTSAGSADTVAIISLETRYAALGTPVGRSMPREIENGEKLAELLAGVLREAPKYGVPPIQSFVRGLPIHNRLDRFYVRAGELTQRQNIMTRHGIDSRQIHGHASVGHDGVRRLDNESLVRFGGPNGKEPLRAYRDYGPFDDFRFPGTRIFIQDGHHRVSEIGRRVGERQIDPMSLIEFQVARP